MSNQLPPLEDLPIFDSAVFTAGDQALTYNQALKRFLRYPSAQGKETLAEIVVNGTSTFNANITVENSSTIDLTTAPFSNLIATDSILISNSDLGTSVLMTPDSITSTNWQLDSNGDTLIGANLTIRDIPVGTLSTITKSANDLIIASLNGPTDTITFEIDGTSVLGLSNTVSTFGTDLTNVNNKWKITNDTGNINMGSTLLIQDVIYGTSGTISKVSTDLSIISPTNTGGITLHCGSKTSLALGFTNSTFATNVTNTLANWNIAQLTGVGTFASIQTGANGTVKIFNSGGTVNTSLQQVTNTFTINSPMETLIATTVGGTLPTTSALAGISFMTNVSGGRNESCIINYQAQASGTTSGGFDFYNVSNVAASIAKIASIAKTQPAPTDNTNTLATTAWVRSMTSPLLSSNNIWTGTNTFNNIVSATTLRTNANGTIKVYDTGNVLNTVMQQLSDVFTISSPAQILIMPTIVSGTLPTANTSVGMGLMSNMSGGRNESILINYQGASVAGTISGGFDFYNVSSTSSSVKIANIVRILPATTDSSTTLATTEWVQSTLTQLLGNNLMTMTINVTGTPTHYVFNLNCNNLYNGYLNYITTTGTNFIDNWLLTGGKVNTLNKIIIFFTNNTFVTKPTGGLVTAYGTLMGDVKSNLASSITAVAGSLWVINITFDGIIYYMDWQNYT